MAVVLSQGPAASADAPGEPVATGHLDGTYVALGPVGAATRSETGAWDTAAGAEVMLVRVREREPLAAVGLAVGAMRLSRAGSSRLWGDLQLGTRRLLDVPAGLSVGASVEIDRVILPHWGVQATVWGYMGVMPFLRIGAAQKSGTYLDLGIKVALPALRM